MSTYATVQDVKDRYEGVIPDSSDPAVQTKLDDAEEFLAARAGDIAARITAGKTTARRVKMVLCNMILRVLRNPTGTRQENAGPFGRSFDQAVASGKLFLTRDDRMLLGLVGGATTVQVGDDALDLPTRYPGLADWRRRPWVQNVLVQGDPGDFQ